MIWQQRISEALQQRAAASGWRQRIACQQGNGRWVIHNGQRYLNFSANDYLGLSRHPAVINAFCQGVRQHGVGSGGSGHITGYHLAHQQLEKALADWLGYPRAIVFISGFAANQAVISCLGQKNDAIFVDKLAHASLLDAAMASQARLRRFAHNSCDALRRLLTDAGISPCLIVTEGVFSMDGDSAPLAGIAALARQHQALLLVDDAHGIGVIGEQGRGSCALAGIKPDLLIITFGKAFGLSGAAVLCGESLAEYLIQFSRHLIYSTAMPAAQALALHEALRLIQQAQPLRDRLQQHIQLFRRGMAELPLIQSESHTAIQPLITGDNQRCLALAQRLRQRGIWVNAIRPPTVPPGSARIRITLSAAHEPQDIERLLQELIHAAAA